MRIVINSKLLNLNIILIFSPLCSTLGGIDMATGIRLGK